jgi:hypothetical protein
MKEMPPDTDILNKQSWTVNKECSSSLGLGQGLTVPDQEKSCYRMLHTASDLEWSKELKIVIRFGTWNVRSL